MFLDLFARHGRARRAGSEATFYLWVEVPGGRPSAPFAYDLLERTGVVVAPGSFFGPEGEGYVRMAMVPTLDGVRARGRAARRRCSREVARRERSRATDRGLLGGRRRTTRRAPIDEAAVRGAIALLDAGELRVAEPDGDGWRVNAWVKQAVLLYFRVRGLETTEVGPVRVPRQAAAQARLRGEPACASCRRPPRATARTWSPAWS